MKGDLTHFADVHNLIASARQAQHLKCTFFYEKMRPNQNTSMNIDSAFRLMKYQESFDVFIVESILHPISSNRNSVAEKLNEISDCNSVFRRAIDIHLAPILHKTRPRLDVQIPTDIKNGLHNAYNQVTLRNIIRQRE